MSSLVPQTVREGWPVSTPHAAACQAKIAGDCTSALDAEVFTACTQRFSPPRLLVKSSQTHGRRALVEGAWASRDHGQGSRPLPRRLETPPKAIQDLSWKAQVRRYQRVRRLMARGTHANHAVGAIAHALGGL